MTTTPPPEAPARPRLNLWPIFFGALLVLVNGFALAILYADVSLHLNDRPSAEMVRKAFISMSILNLILGGASLASSFLIRRPPQQTPDR